jgi:hypothetical protein
LGSRSSCARERLLAQGTSSLPKFGVANSRGADRIAACWANGRKVPHMAFKPD